MNTLHFTEICIWQKVGCLIITHNRNDKNYTCYEPGGKPNAKDFLLYYRDI